MRVRDAVLSELLKNHGQFLSGEQLAADLSVLKPPPTAGIG